MPTTAGRRIGIVVVLLLVAGAGALATLPHSASALRVGPLSLLWWYGAILAPVAAAIVTAVVLVPRPSSQGPVSPR